MAGKFVISLDYELHWGFFDNRDLESSKQALLNVNEVIDELLELCDNYQVKITFATVGFLFAKSKDDIYKYQPKSKPNYRDQSLNPYKLLEGIGTSEEDAPFYYAPSGINKIRKKGIHEIGTHTFSHYYCNEEGQTPINFKDDLSAAIEIAKASDITIQSIVFPRNQAQDDCVNVCQELGLTSYRGDCWFNLNNANKQLSLFDYPKVFLRVLDSYINLTGSNAYQIEHYNRSDQNIVNIPSSRFLRPFNSKLSFMEPLKIRRIKRAMTKAAKQGKIYHLWWHPHNFGNNMQENFNNLKQIFKHFKVLNETYNFQTATMSDVASSYKL